MSGIDKLNGSGMLHLLAALFRFPCFFFYFSLMKTEYQIVDLDASYPDRSLGQKWYSTALYFPADFLGMSHVRFPFFANGNDSSCCLLSGMSSSMRVIGVLAGDAEQC